MVKLPIRLSESSREPIYHQIEQQLKALIAGGHLPANTSLPSIRVLAKDLKISVITTRRAYQNLEAKGFIRTIQGKGTFVAEVEETLKKEVKVTNVNQAFEKAINIAYAYDYTDKEIIKLFNKVLHDCKMKKEGE